MGETSGWTLECVKGDLAPGRFEINEAGVTLGRDAGNTAVLNSNNVSRRHARIFIYEGAPWVQDLGSRNGVFVGAERIPEQKSLSVGDTVSVGEFTFKVLGPVGAAKAASAGGPALNLAAKKKPLIIGGAGVAVVIGVIVALSGGGSEPAAQDPAATGAAADPAAGQLFDFQESKKPAQGGQPANADGQPATRNLDVASVSIGGQGEGAQLSPEQRSQLVKEYLERGLMAQDTGRLAQARDSYEKALQLDPTCALCQSRLDRVVLQIKDTTQKHYDLALKYYNSMRYEEAVQNWELVLNLQQDKNSEIYRKSVDYIAEANKKLDTSQQY